MTDAAPPRAEEDQMAETKPYRILHDQVMARPGAIERLAALREQTLEEIALFELRRTLDLSQTDLASELGVSQSAVSQLENSHDPKVSTVREYLARLGAQLRLVAVFNDGDEERSVVLHIGEGPPRNE